MNMGYPHKKHYPNVVVESITMVTILVFLFFVVLPYFGGSEYPDINDLFNLISKIIGSVKI